MAETRLSRVFVLSVVCGLCLSSIAGAQLPQTRLYSLLPNGGRIGQEFEVSILSGDDLDEVSQLTFSHPKIATRQKTVEKNGAQVPVANSFIVTVPADVAAGVYEVRCGGLFGFSNPRRFAIDHAEVVADPADNNSPDKAAPLGLGQVVNGRLESANDVDWFRVSANAGQRVVFDVWAERLDSKMNPVIAIYDSTGRRRLDWSRNSIGYDPVIAFDVPADGDYCILVRDITYRNGNEYGYRLHAHTNPHLEYAWPPAGKSGMKSKFTLFGYNLPGGQKNGQRLNDVELESVEVEIDIPAAQDLLTVENRVRPVAAAMDAFSYRLTTDGHASNPVRIGISPMDVVLEAEPNDTALQAQRISVPVELGGQFGNIGDTDTFRFEAKSGEVYFIDVSAERLGTTTDPYLVVNQIVIKADGTEEVKRLTALDDVPTNPLANIFEIKTDDPVFRLQIPADGLYEVVLRDRYWESRGNLQLRYALAVRKETPDFRVVAVPSAPTPGTTWPTGLRRGDQFPISVLAFRQDGFNGPITVFAENLPAGFSCPEVVIGPGEATSTLVLVSHADAPSGRVEINLQAKGVLPVTGGDQTTQEVQRSVRAGTVVWNTAANVPAISRITETLSVSILDEAAPFQMKSEIHRVTVNQGRQILVPVQIEKRDGFDDKITLTTQGIVKASNIDFPNAELAKGEAAKTLRVFVAENSPPGVYTAWMKTQGQVGYRRNPKKAEALLKISAEAKTAAESAKAAATTATQSKNEVTTTFTQSQQKLQQTQTTLKTAEATVATTKTQLDQSRQTLDAANVKVTEEKNKATKLEANLAEVNKTLSAKQVELDAAEKNLQTALAELEKLKNESTAAELKIVELTKQSEDQPDNAELKTQLEQATQAAASAKEAVVVSAKSEQDKTGVRDAAKKQLADVTTLQQQTQQQLTTSQQQLATLSQLATEAQTKFTAAEQGLAKANADLEAAKVEVTLADAAMKAAEKSKTEAEAAEKMAVALAASTEAARVAAEKAATDADNAAKPKNINFTPPSTPIVIEVLPSPTKLAATVANAGKVKKGETLEISLKVTRQNNFAGPVQLTLSLPPGVNGLTAEPVEIPADQAEGKLIVHVTGESPDGKIENVVVRANSDFNGKAEVDAPVAIEVSP